MTKSPPPNPFLRKLPKPVQFGASSCLNADCIDVMKKLGDKSYDLAIVDPPYGFGRHAGHSRTQHTVYSEWDNEVPSQKYWDELFRVSKNQIVWGGNYFTLPVRRCWIIWDKRPMPPSFAACELAWTSYDKNAEMWNGKTGNEVSVEDRIHPTQKPVALYKWLLMKYAQPGQRILDTHMGSGSSVIAALDGGFEILACEIGFEYFKAATERISRYLQQGILL